MGKGIYMTKEEQLANLKTDNEGLKDCLLARDCAIKEYKKENEALKQHIGNENEYLAKVEQYTKLEAKYYALQARLEAMEERAGVDEIEAKLFHWVGIEIAEHRSVDMHDDENRERLAKDLSTHIKGKGGEVMKDNNWQFVSLDLAKQLKKAGYPQEGLWAWCDISHGEYEERDWDIRPLIWDKNKPLIGECVAPTVAELEKALPRDYYVCQKNLWHKDKNIEINHFDNDLDKPLDYLTAIAKMWLYLKKEGKV